MMQGKGLHLLAELYGCPHNLPLLCEKKHSELYIVSAVRATSLTILGTSFHQFETGGVAGVVVLAESHIAIHTWPEIGYVTLDVFVCNYSKDNTELTRTLFDQLIHECRPEKIVRHELIR